MQKIVYIQADQQGQVYSANGAVAAKGFGMLGYEVRYFQPTEVGTLSLTPDSVVVGGVPTVRSALEALQVRSLYYVSIPSELKPFAGREVWRTTFQEVLGAGRFPIFIKPFEDSKAFAGKVVTQADEVRQMLIPKQGYPSITLNTEVLAQEAVHFLSEWRVFVVHGRPVGVSNYQGDPLLFPSSGIIRATLGAYQNVPAGCSLDFGVTDDGRTLLIETNDGYSLGHGGLTAIGYAELLRARWEELTAQE